MSEPAGTNLTPRMRYRLYRGMTGLFLWPALSASLVFAMLSAIAGGSTSHQPRGLVYSHGRLSRIDPALWDTLRLAENSWPFIAAFLLIAAAIFLYESGSNRIVRAPRRLRVLGVTFCWTWVALSTLVLTAPLAFVLIRLCGR